MRLMVPPGPYVGRGAPLTRRAGQTHAVMDAAWTAAASGTAIIASILARLSTVSPGRVQPGLRLPPAVPVDSGSGGRSAVIAATSAFERSGLPSARSWATGLTKAACTPRRSRARTSPRHVLARPTPAAVGATSKVRAMTSSWSAGKPSSTAAMTPALPRATLNTVASRNAAKPSPACAASAQPSPWARRSPPGQHGQRHAGAMVGPASDIATRRPSHD